MADFGYAVSLDATNRMWQRILVDALDESGAVGVQVSLDRHLGRSATSRELSAARRAARASGADDPVDVGLLGDVAGDYHDFGFESDVTRSSKRVVEMSTAMTRPPSRATRDAVARPMPDAAPVTITVRPSNRPGVTRN